VWIATPEAPAAVEPARAFGLTGEERLRRALAGTVVAAVTCGAKPPAPRPGRLAVFRSDVVYDERVTLAWLDAPDGVLISEDSRGARPVAAVTDASRVEEARRWLLEAEPLPRHLRTVTPDALVPAYTAKLRKLQPPIVRFLEPGRTGALEKLLFDASYKGLTDFVTKFVWPAPALRVVRALAEAGVTPNAVTALSWALVVLTTFLFAEGWLATGLAAGWLMTFLDTVDGKLARVTLRSSRVGHVLDHGLDLVHPPFWYAAFGLPLAQAGPAWISGALWIVLGGYLVGRLVEGVFIRAFGFEIHSWRPVDSTFRLIVARRNPNMALLTAAVLAGRPDWGLGAVAAWTVVSIAFQSVRLGQAVAERLAGRPLASWQESIAAGEAT
jgi:phosphatidylglycerophosphate synthase